MSAPGAPGARMPRVALTGGVACGKSAVAALFAAYGVPVLDADLIAREVVAPGTALLATLFTHFGAGIRAADGALDRAALRQLVFADDARRRELEALLHPAIRERTEQLAAQAVGPYQLHVVPLLVETRGWIGEDGRRRFARVLVVDCPEPLQWRRLLAREGMSESQARAILAAQATRAARLAVADDVILNDGPLEALPPRVAALHARYRELGAPGARD
jgi:dephospho-CoA kinase